MFLSLFLSFFNTLNKQIQIDVHQEIIVQKVCNEWQEYIGGLAKVEEFAPNFKLLPGELRCIILYFEVEAL